MDVVENNMFKRLKHFIKRKIKKMSNTEIKIEDYRKIGISIGTGCHIYTELPTTRDCFLLKIGNNVTISPKVVFLLHDSSIEVPTKHSQTDLLGEINVLDNCFIGFGSIILPGVTVAEGTIIAAGTVVTKSVSKPYMVVGGNPAKYICSVNDFYEKNNSRCFNLNNMSFDDVKREVLNNHDKLLTRKEMK